MKNFLRSALFILIAFNCASQPFPFDGSVYYVCYMGGSQKLVAMNSYPASYSTTTVCNIQNSNYANCLAANPVDGYIYYRGGMSDLYKMGASGGSTLVA